VPEKIAQVPLPNLGKTTGIIGQKIVVFLSSKDFTTINDSFNWMSARPYRQKSELEYQDSPLSNLTEIASRGVRVKSYEVEEEVERD